MTPRRTHITLAALAIASLVAGVVALRSLSGVPERSAVTPTSRDILVANGRVASPAATGGASGLAAPFLPGLRGHFAPESEPSPPAGTIALVENRSNPGRARMARRLKRKPVRRCLQNVPPISPAGKRLPRLPCRRHVPPASRRTAKPRRPSRKNPPRPPPRRNSPSRMFRCPRPVLALSPR